MVSNRKIIYLLVLGVIAGLAWLRCPQQQVNAEEEPQYVGTEVCSTCHAEVAKKWELTVHRRTLFNKEPSKRGCEACHGPGGAHVAGGGDKTKIIRPSKLEPRQATAICQKCHTQEEVTMWPTSAHASANLTCSNCHDPHSPGEKSLLADVDDAKLASEGLARSLKQAQLAANIAAVGSEEKEAADKKVAELEAEKKKLQAELKGVETAYHRSAEPYVCYSCHKTQEIQSKMPSHHPVQEGKVKCSDCHNPHGGPSGMLREETVGETCYKCHADKHGPFTFEHPPVTEDCSTCHSPHGSVNNNLLVQSQPFVCLKCHVGPHSRSNALGSPVNVARYYTECTDCHTQIHGSDSRASFRY